MQTPEPMCDTTVMSKDAHVKNTQDVASEEDHEFLPASIDGDSLHIFGNDGAVAEAICMLRKSKTLKALMLGSEMVTHQHLLPLADVLKNHPTIERLCIHIGLSDMNAITIANFAVKMTGNYVLKKIDSNNFLHCECIITQESGSRLQVIYAIAMANQLLEAIVKRNIEISKEPSQKDKINQEFVKDWNKELPKKIAQIGLDGVDFALTSPISDEPEPEEKQAEVALLVPKRSEFFSLFKQTEALKEHNDKQEQQRDIEKQEVTPLKSTRWRCCNIL